MSGPYDFRDTFAPGVPESVRQLLRERSRGGAGGVAAARPAAGGVPAAGGEDLTVLLGVLLGVLFGVAGAAVVVAGAPAGSAGAEFQVVAGGGCLLVALLALLLAARSARTARRVRASVRLVRGRHVGGAELEALTERAPDLGALAGRTQRAADRVRRSVGFREGWLDVTLDAERLDAAEWSAVQQVCELAAERASTAEGDDRHAPDLAVRRATDRHRRCDDLVAFVERLEELADSTDQLGRALDDDRASTARAVRPPGDSMPAATDEVADAVAVVGELERHVRSSRPPSAALRPQDPRAPGR